MLAYRGWNLAGARHIKSPYVQYEWAGQGNIAVCNQGHGLTLAPSPNRTIGCANPPNPLCLCGFYACPTFDSAILKCVYDNSTNCVGLVSAYGRIIVHQDGIIRAQYMDIIAIAVIAHIEYDVKDDYYGCDPPFPFHKDVNITSLEVEQTVEALGIHMDRFDKRQEAERWISDMAALWEATHIAG